MTSEREPTPGGFYRGVVERPVAILMLSAAVLVFGVIAYGRLRLNLLPDLSYPSLTVRTLYPGAAPAEVETEVSRKLEERLATLPGLINLASVSRAERSDIQLEFAWGTDVDLALQQVGEKIDQERLAEGIERPLILRYDPSLEPVLRIGLFGEAGERALREFADDDLKRQLESVEGVASAQPRGGLEPEIRVELSDAKLALYNLDILNVATRIQQENLNAPGGRVKDAQTDYLIRTVNAFQTVEGLAALQVAARTGAASSGATTQATGGANGSGGGSLSALAAAAGLTSSKGSASTGSGTGASTGGSIAAIRLADIGTVRLGEKERQAVTRINGRDGVVVEVYREADANIVQVARAAKAKLFGTGPKPGTRPSAGLSTEPGKAAGDKAGTGEAQVSKNRETNPSTNRRSDGPRATLFSPGVALPPGVEMRVLSDQALFIERSIDEIRESAWQGAVLAIIVMFLFLARFGSTLVLAVSIPVSVVAAFIPMLFADVSLNLMTLGGLALGIGMLVDNSIVVLESIIRCREEGDDPKTAAIRGTAEVGGAVLASTLTTVAVFLPIVFVEGIAGQIFGNLALTVVFSLSASLVVALTIVPTLVARIEHDGTGLSGLAQARAWFSATGVAAPFNPLSPFRRRWAERPHGAGLVLWAPSFAVTAVVEALLALIGRTLLTLVVLVGGLVVGVGWLASLIGRWTAVPVAHGFNWVFERFADGYARGLRFTVRNPALMFVAVAAMTVWTIYTAPTLGSTLLPEIHRGELTLQASLPVGTSLASTIERTRPLEAAVRESFPGADVMLSAGVEETEENLENKAENIAHVLVKLPPPPPGTSLIAWEEQAAGKLRALAGTVAGAETEVDRPALFSLRAPLSVEVRGFDLAALEFAARRVEALAAESGEFTDIRSSVRRGRPEYQIIYDRDRLLALGLEASRVADVVKAKLTGVVAGQFPYRDQRIDIRVQGDPEAQRSQAALRDFVINPGATLPVKLSSIAEIETREGPAEIRRIGQERAAVVDMGAKGFDLGAAARELQNLMQGQAWPPDTVVKVGGQLEEMQRSLASLQLALALAIFLVYVVMAAQFESIKDPLLIMFTVPLALIGVVAALYFTGLPISVIVLVGVIVLAGVVVNNAIVLVDYFKKLLERGRSVEDAVVEAGRVRLRPILITTLTTVIGLVPMATAQSEGAEIRQPMAATIIAGLSVSTILTLVVIPVLLVLFTRDKPAATPVAEAQA
jgi:hydrophobic/amphiphilic exporter-1 (mainly G- bacteria), HAE1 family